MSCLQSLRLVHQAWLRPFEERLLTRTNAETTAAATAANVTSPSNRKKFATFFKLGDRKSASSDSRFPLAFEESIRLSLDKSEVVGEGEDGGGGGASTAEPAQSLPSLAVLTAVVKSAVLCSDLFTTREQFLWLIGYLQAGACGHKIQI